MTPEQTKRRIAVMAKYGEPGWRIEYRPYGGKVWAVTETPTWGDVSTYRAVRIETTPGKRVPLPWSTIKCGMVVRDSEERSRKMTVIEMTDTTLWCGRGLCKNHADLFRLEYLDGNEWKPLWTEEPGIERIVEVISEEDARFPASKDGIL